MLNQSQKLLKTNSTGNFVTIDLTTDPSQTRLMFKNKFSEHDGGPHNIINRAGVSGTLANI